MILRVRQCSRRGVVQSVYLPESSLYELYITNIMGETPNQTKRAKLRFMHYAARLGLGCN